MDDLKQTVLEAQAGDGAAFAELVRRFQDMAVGYAVRILNDFQLAEDAAQDAFLEAFRVLPQLKDPNAFPAWLRRVVYKQCDRYRRRKPLSQAVSMETESIPSLMPSPDQAMEFRERRMAVQNAIGELPEVEREAILLCYFGDQAQREIADFLGVPLTTLKKRLYTGRQRLKERMLYMVEQDLNEQRPSKSEAFSGRIRHLAGPHRWQPGWEKERSADGTFANVYNADGLLVEIEQYESAGEYCGKEPLVNVRTVTPDGELIVQHVAHRISDDAYDIHVTDSAGRLHVVLHHSDVSRGEPFTIKEEWMDRVAS
jgi:RNA polymerase sigma factor (sigma-70 family)